MSPEDIIKAKEAGVSDWAIQYLVSHPSPEHTCCLACREDQ